MLAVCPSDILVPSHTEHHYGCGRCVSREKNLNEVFPTSGEVLTGKHLNPAVEYQVYKVLKSRAYSFNKQQRRKTCP